MHRRSVPTVSREARASVWWKVDRELCVAEGREDKNGADNGAVQYFPAKLKNSESPVCQGLILGAAGGKGEKGANVVCDRECEGTVMVRESDTPCPIDEDAGICDSQIQELPQESGSDSQASTSDNVRPESHTNAPSFGRETLEPFNFGAPMLRESRWKSSERLCVSSHGLSRRWTVPAARSKRTMITQEKAEVPEAGRRVQKLDRRTHLSTKDEMQTVRITHSVESGSTGEKVETTGDRGEGVTQIPNHRTDRYKHRLNFARCSWAIDSIEPNGGAILQRAVAAKERGDGTEEHAGDTASNSGHAVQGVQEETDVCLTQGGDVLMDQTEGLSQVTVKTVRVTRRFMVDGKEVSVSSCKRPNEPNGRDHKERSVRRQELQELRLLQREEKKSQSQLEQRMQHQRELMFRHIEQEIIGKKEYYGREIETQERQMEQARGRREEEHTNRLRQDALRLKSQQQKERIKNKAELKDKFKEEQGLLVQQQELNRALQKVVTEHKKKVSCIEWENLCKIHSLKRARESVILSLEERHLQEKYQLFRQQVTEQYGLQRQQLCRRHEKVRAEELRM
ncbi:hypothetical protein FKM82_026707 [Ascaphus truei]